VKKAPPITSDRIPKKLKAIRVALGLSQNEILERLGFGDFLFRSNISQYERGLRVPAPAVLLAYARLANLDVAILIDDDLEMPRLIHGTIKSKRPHRPK
jgi:transcriptional regulator with XRE-family HTH domain